MNELFDKSYKELRDNFVRARFAEGQHFGREDIEEWLEGQRQAELPDVESWEAISGLCSTNFCVFVGTRAQVKHLLSLLTPDDLGGLEQLSQKPGLYDQGMMVALHHLLSSLPEGEVKIFGEAAEAIWLDGIGLLQTEWQFGSSVRLTLHKAGPNISSRLLFVEWAQARPNFAKAREILCNAFADVIGNIRKSAEVDFDRAVAVSADGKEIVCADEVWVYTDVGYDNPTRLPKSLFAQSKTCCRKETFCRHGTFYRTMDEGARTLKEIIRLCQGYVDSSHPRGQYLVPFDDGRGAFVTHEDQVPEEILTAQ